MDRPPVYRLFRQEHRRVSASGRDKRWKHLSAKPATRLDFPWGSLQTTTLIGCRCKHSDVFSRAVLIARELFFSPPWTQGSVLQRRVLSDTSKFYSKRERLCKATLKKYTIFCTSSQGSNTDIKAIDSVGVPPLPIPNREVKPNSADGTANVCGRVGHRHFFRKRNSCKRVPLFFVCIRFFYGRWTPLGT